MYLPFLKVLIEFWVDYFLLQTSCPKFAKGGVREFGTKSQKRQVFFLTTPLRNLREPTWVDPTSGNSHGVTHLRCLHLEWPLLE